MTSKKAKILVVDSNAFIKQVRIETIGQKFYTIPQVLSEVRDAKARQFMQNFPFEIIERDPSPEALKAVAAFARKTGDYAFLSPVDLRVLALVYTLEAETKGSVSHLRSEPLPSSAALNAASTSASSNNKDNKEDDNNNEEAEGDDVEDGDDGEGASEEKEKENTADNATTQETTQEEEESAESEKKDEDDGWITPDNIGVVRAKRGQDEDDLKDEEVDVGCFTTDFAMQSVLIQMGLKLLSVQGMVIKKIRQFVLKCHSCFKICKDMERKFCPTCGNNTMLRFSASTDDQGNTIYTQAQRLNNRGTIFSIPLPRGGRNSNDMVLTEDVYLHKTRYQRNPKDTDVFDQEYSFAQNRTGPSQKIVIGAGKKNPNVAKRRIGKKNKPISTL